MSAGIIIQQKNKCYICSDSAISANINGNRKRISNKGKKIFEHNKKLYFCSGDMFIVDNIKKYIINNNDNVIGYIKKIMKNENSMLELFIIENNNEIITTHQISSYNNYKDIIRTIKDNNTLLLSIGYNNKKNINIAESYIGKCKNINDLYYNIFKNICCEEIGGIISIYEVNKKTINHINDIDLDDGFLIYKNDKKNINKYLLVGETIVGRILLGQQLYITSEDDSENAKSFYIGNIRGNHPDPDGNDFGIQICDRGATTERVFLGIENGVAKLRLVNDNISGGKSETEGSILDKRVVLSDEGVQMPDNVYHADNVDPTHSLKIRYRVDESTIEIRRAFLNIYRDKFRAYEKGAKSSGQVAGTSGASNVMTTGASSKSTSGASSKSTSGSSSSTTTGISSYKTEIGDTLTSKPIANVELMEHVHRVQREDIEHTHNMTHTHNMEHNHNMEHTHSMEHTHELMLEGHTHEIIYGIYEDTLPTNMNVYVNGELIKTRVNSDSEIDIAEYLNVGMNEIEITSETLGRICVNIWAKMFMKW